MYSCGIWQWWSTQRSQMTTAPSQYPATAWAAKATGSPCSMGARIEISYPKSEYQPIKSPISSHFWCGCRARSTNCADRYCLGLSRDVKAIFAIISISWRIQWCVWLRTRTTGKTLFCREGIRPNIPHYPITAYIIRESTFYCLVLVFKEKQ